MTFTTVKPGVGLYTNSNTKKLGCYQGGAGQWITAYELNGEFYTEDRGFITKSTKEDIERSLKYEEERSKAFQAWLNRKQK